MCQKVCRKVDLKGCGVLCIAPYKYTCTYVCICHMAPLTARLRVWWSPTCVGSMLVLLPCALSFVARWNDITRRLMVWVEILELNDQGQYMPVPVREQVDVKTGGVYQLKQVGVGGYIREG